MQLSQEMLIKLAEAFEKPWRKRTKEEQYWTKCGICYGLYKLTGFDWNDVCNYVNEHLANTNKHSKAEGAYWWPRRKSTPNNFYRRYDLKRANALRKMAEELV